MLYANDSRFIGDFSGSGDYEITLPTGFEFNTSATVSVTGSSADITIGANSFPSVSKWKFSYTYVGSTVIDVITISDLEVKNVSNNFFFSPNEEKIAFFILISNVTCIDPSILFGLSGPFGILKVPGHRSRIPNNDLPPSSRRYLYSIIINDLNLIFDRWIWVLHRDTNSPWFSRSRSLSRTHDGKDRFC